MLLIRIKLSQSFIFKKKWGQQYRYAPYESSNNESSDETCGYETETTTSYPSSDSSETESESDSENQRVSSLEESPRPQNPEFSGPRIIDSIYSRIDSY